MSRHYGIHGSAWPTLGRVVRRLLGAGLGWLAARRGYYRPDSAMARHLGAQFRAKLDQGETLYLIGLGAGGHNAGAALVRCSKAHGIELLSNHEEERFSGVKHDSRFPVQALATLRAQLSREGVDPSQIHACLGTWDYPAFAAMTIGEIVAEAPWSWAWLLPRMRQGLTDPAPLFQALWYGSKRLGTALGLSRSVPIVGQRHHDGHAYFSYAASPFTALKDQPTMVVVIDGAGDTGSVSLYLAQGQNLRRVYDNGSFFDSLGHLYSILSATQGGWTPLSSEGRSMGAAAWGNGCRLTNPYYKRLRQILYFGKDGQVLLNRRMAQWPLKGLLKPYGKELVDLLGDPIPLEKMWNPDQILRVDDIEHADVTRQRLDKAAALQLVFEDALFHIIEHFIRQSGSHQLILTGGCALNCVANMRLLEHFNEDYFSRYLGQGTKSLALWVPPIPGDAGATVGAAYAFALQHGASVGPPMTHAFYCGDEPSEDDIADAMRADDQVGWVALGQALVSGPESPIADLMAFLIEQQAVLGLFQGRAETGPRALGHRSILANPCRVDALAHLNTYVKHRERIRPLAPMATLAAAHQFFELPMGASQNDFQAYDFMVLTAKARPAAKAQVPAVVHEDGTSRLQIVRAEIDPFMHAILKALGRRVGVEMVINTSLNVGSPIAQTPRQAVAALRRSRGLDGIVFVTASGEAWVAYDRTQEGVKDGGQRLLSGLRTFAAMTQVSWG
jgi:carbamoyltransferase